MMNIDTNLDEKVGANPMPFPFPSLVSQKVEGSILAA